MDRKNSKETEMKSILFRFLAASIIVIMLTACGSKIAAGTQPSVELTPLKSSNTPSAITVKLPQGIFVNTNDKYGLTFCNLQGQTTTEFKTSGITNLEPGEVVIAGSVPAGPIQVPIVYLEHNPEPGLKVNLKDQISTLVTSPNIFQIAGAPGLPVLAYSRVDAQDNGRTYKLFVGTLDGIATAPAIISHYDEKYLFVYNPLAVAADGSSIKGVWYTQTPWGVGGEGFLRNKGLNFYDYATGEIKEYLDANQNFQGLSLDQSMAAIMDESVAEKPAFRIVNLKTKGVTTIAVDPTSDNGGGAVKFSPDNRYMAWMESGGTSMSDTPDFHSRLRVAQLGATPGLVIDLTDADVSKTLGYPEVYAAEPVGWLDGQTLLVYVHEGLNKLDVTSGKFTPFCRGSFVAFAYQ